MNPGTWAESLAGTALPSTRGRLLRAILWHSLGMGFRRRSGGALISRGIPPLREGRGALERALLPVLDEAPLPALVLSRADAAYLCDVDKFVSLSDIATRDGGIGYAPVTSGRR